MNKSESLKIASRFLGKNISVRIDRPLGSQHPEHSFAYDANYGHIPNTCAPDGDELDAYYLGIDIPLQKDQEIKGECIAVIHRLDDDDDKLVVVPSKVKITNEEIERLTKFQEQWFKHEIIRKITE